MCIKTFHWGWVTPENQRKFIFELFHVKMPYFSHFLCKLHVADNIFRNFLEQKLSEIIFYCKNFEFEEK